MLPYSVVHATENRCFLQWATGSDSGMCTMRLQKEQQNEQKQFSATVKKILWRWGEQHNQQ
jgi:hypothetical protein